MFKKYCDTIKSLTKKCNTTIELGNWENTKIKLGYWDDTALLLSNLDRYWNVLLLMGDDIKRAG